jgi:hypothetical protein
MSDHYAAFIWDSSARQAICSWLQQAPEKRKELIMNEFQIVLSAEEKEVLAKLLEHEISQRLVEEHRTRSPSYREYIQHDESVLQGVLTKLNEAHAATVAAI